MLTTGDMKVLADLLAKAAVNYDIAAELFPYPNHKNYLARAADHYGRALQIIKSRDLEESEGGRTPLNRRMEDDPDSDRLRR